MLKELVIILFCISGVTLLFSCQKRNNLDHWMKESGKLHSADAIALRQWLQANAFDPKNFSVEAENGHRSDQSVLVRDKRVHSIRATGVRSLEALSQMDALVDLNLRKMQIVNLAHCPPGLTTIQLAYGDLNSLHGIESCKNLQSAKIISTEIRDFAPVMSLSGLQSLSVERHQLETITIPGMLSNLKTLVLSHNHIKRISGLEQLPNLETLVLKSNQLTALDGIDRLSKLTSVDLSNNVLTDLDRLEVSSSVTSLNISDNKVDDLSPLLAWTSLKEIIHRPVEADEEIPAELLSKIDGRFSDAEIQESTARSMLHNFIESSSFVETLNDQSQGKVLSVSRQTKSSFSTHSNAEITGRIEVGELRGMVRLPIASSKDLLHQYQTVMIQGMVRVESGGLFIFSPVELDFWQQARQFVDRPVREPFRDDSLKVKGFVRTEVKPGEPREFSANLIPFASDYVLLISSQSKSASNIQMTLRP
ncbi:MAG: leucine-rich repeat domain-containing protein [Verrucomicrobiales bacterium]